MYQYKFITSMNFSKNSASNGIQFGSPKTSTTLNSSDSVKTSFNKYAAFSKNNLNLSGDESIKKFGKYSSRATSQIPETLKTDGKSHTRHATEFNDSLEGSQLMNDVNYSNNVIVELELQISSLKN